MLRKTSCPNEVKDGTPSPDQGPWCQGGRMDDPDAKFGSKEKNCTELLKKLNKNKLKKKCKEDDVKEACPSFCSSSTCVDPCADTTEKIKLEGGKKTKCKKIKDQEDPKCEKIVKNTDLQVKELCPTACQLERCTSVPDTCAADETKKLKLKGGKKTKCKKIKDQDSDLCEAKVKNTDLLVEEFCPTACKLNGCTS